AAAGAVAEVVVGEAAVEVVAVVTAGSVAGPIAGVVVAEVAAGPAAEMVVEGAALAVEAAAQDLGVYGGQLHAARTVRAVLVDMKQRK
ncbi:hypothetical protein LPJ81_006583, partial [Coemansia sp. IMI 209127]